MYFLCYYFCGTLNDKKKYSKQHKLYLFVPGAKTCTNAKDGNGMGFKKNYK